MMPGINIISSKEGFVMVKSINFKFLLFIYIVLYLIHFKISMVNGTDDVWFADVSNTTPLIEWITMRYMTWSGRILPDTMLYLLLDEYLWIWRLLNPFFLVLLAYSIVKMIKKEVTRIELVLVIVIMGYISFGILNSGFFWITGSMNYLWPIALGFFGIVPFASSVFNQDKISNKMFFLFVLAEFWQLFQMSKLDYVCKLFP